MSRAAAVGPDGQPAADDLAERRQIGPHAEQRLRSAVGHAEAGHHFVEDQQAPCAAVSSRAARQKFARRHDAAHVAHDRLEDHRGDLAAALGETPLQTGRIVVSAARACLAPCPRVTPGELGTPSVAAELPAATSRLSTWP